MNITVIGATGYAGSELLRLLADHPKVSHIAGASRSHCYKKLGALYHGHRMADLELEAVDIAKIAKHSDLVFTALPHGVSAKTVAALYEKGVKVIDLSGDYRYEDAALYEKWYGMPHLAPHLLPQAVYGLSEINRDAIKGADIVGNPGCYTTCAILALYPLLAAGVIKADGIIIDAKSGVTGAGRKPSQALHFCETSGNFKAYKVAEHRHTSEIEDQLGKAAGQPVALSFTPHLLPIKRGILETIYCQINGDIDRETIYQTYVDIYGDKPFVHVMAEGLPEVKSVVGSNNVAMGFVIDKRLGRLVIVSALDNLIKGAVGQAIQNMNIQAGWGETTGLPITPWYL